MFSATFPKIARDIAKEHLAHDHVRVRKSTSHRFLRFIVPELVTQCLLHIRFVSQRRQQYSASPNQ